jgi:hypothetical protein
LNIIKYSINKRQLSNNTKNTSSSNNPVSVNLNSMLSMMNGGGSPSDQILIQQSSQPYQKLKEITT